MCILSVKTINSKFLSYIFLRVFSRNKILQISVVKSTLITLYAKVLLKEFSLNKRFRSVKLKKK